jgi:hypothetical protein
MKIQLENTFEIFFLGVMVGLYGNWLISFFDRLIFPTQVDLLFFVQFALAAAVLLSFSAYFISAFVNRFDVNPNLFWVLNVVLSLTCFIYQDSFIKHDANMLGSNIVFWVMGVIILSVILPIEWLSSGRRHASMIKKRWKKPKIGILNDMGWDATNPEISTYTDISPEQWKQALSDDTFETELIDVNSEFEGFIAILNPYGALYPEVDVNSFTTLHKIQGFVKEGGLFINISDIPSYYAYDLKIKRRLDLTQAIYMAQNNQVTVVRPFELTPMVKELGLRVLAISPPQQQNFGAFSASPQNILSERIAFMETNTTALIPTIPWQGSTVSSFFEAKYGEGDLLISLCFLDKPAHTQQAKDTIKNAIVQSAKNNLRTKINLHKK